MSNPRPPKPETRAQQAGAAPGVGLIDFASLPEGTRTTIISIRASDGVASRGILYTRGGERVVVCFSHPRGDMSQHYAVPSLLGAGYAAYGHQCRGLNNDVDCEHEKLLLDLAAGFGHLKDVCGFENLVLLGNSGGGSLLCFYQQQAVTPSPGRLTTTPAGEPCDLNASTLPKADGVILMAVHPGEGQFMLDSIDPSIVDESDRLSIDPTLDMYNPANGFREPPESSSYSSEFVARYRSAQRARVERLDARAKGYITDQRYYKALMEREGYAELSLQERTYTTRRSLPGVCMIVYRTEANLAYCDLSLHAWKSTRVVGSLISPRPDRQNYNFGGFSQYITPRAWLSSWSGLSSRADLLNSLKTISEPLLMISFTNDNGCFPDSNKEQVEACPSSDKTMEFIAADHFGRPVPQRDKAMNVVVAWLRARFPASAGAAA